MTDKKLVTLQESDALRALPAVRLDPQALIAKAIEQGAGIETLERLVGLAQEIHKVSAREAFYAAKAEFKRLCPVIKKTETAKIVTRSGGSYSYKYSPLDEITSVVDPILSPLGLSYSWRHPKDAPANTVSTICVLAHKLGHEDDSGPITLPIGADERMSGAQRGGSVLTYSKRYSLQSVLGITTEEDNDARPPGDDFKPTREADGRKPASHGSTSAESGAPVAREHYPRPPEDPSVFLEASQTLLPTPDDDVERERLLNRLREGSQKIASSKKGKKEQEAWAADKAEAWKTYCGDATPSTADLASLADLVKWLESRVPK